MREMEGRSVKVEIYGVQYTLKTDDSDVEKVRRIAQYVDGMMKQIRRKRGYSSPMELAILAALNIADRLYESNERVEKVVRKLIDELDEALRGG